MIRKPGWALLYFLMSAILVAMLAAHFMALPGVPEQAVLTAGMVAIPIVVMLWLRANRLALLHSGAEKDDLYQLTTYEYKVALWTDDAGLPRTVVAHSEFPGAEANTVNAGA